MSQAEKVKVRILKLDPERINDPKVLIEWDKVWDKVRQLRMAIGLARQTGRPIAVEMMQEYEQARNAERQFFWDHVYEQDAN
jgi:hypothetical protein